MCSITVEVRCSQWASKTCQCKVTNHKIQGETKVQRGQQHKSGSVLVHWMTLSLLELNLWSFTGIENQSLPSQCRSLCDFQTLLFPVYLWLVWLQLWLWLIQKWARDCLQAFALCHSQELRHWLCSPNLWMYSSSGKSFCSDCQMTCRVLNLDSNLNSAAWPTSLKVIFALKSLNKLYGVWFVYRSQTATSNDANIEACCEWCQILNHIVTVL